MTSAVAAAVDYLPDLANGTTRVRFSDGFMLLTSTLRCDDPNPEPPPLHDRDYLDLTVRRAGEARTRALAEAGGHR